MGGVGVVGARVVEEALQERLRVHVGPRPRGVAARGRWGAGGLDPLLSLAYSRHNETQRQAARALSNLSLSQETRDLMVQRGAVKVFVSLAAATNMDVSRLAVPALAALAEAHTTALVDAGAVPT